MITSDEQAILDHVAEAWRLWCGLPYKHPSDEPEFHAAIHQLQLLVAYRVACRAAPESFGWHDLEEHPLDGGLRSRREYLG